MLRLEQPKLSTGTDASVPAPKKNGTSMPRSPTRSPARRKSLRSAKRRQTSARVAATSDRGGHGEIAALDRAVTLLLAVADTLQPTALNQAAQRTGLSKATAFRILSTLAAEGLVSQDEASGSYRLGVVPLRLATALLDSVPVRGAARQQMRALSEELNETVVLSVREGDTRVNIDAVECSNAISTARRFGEPRPLHMGAASRVLLSGMDEAEIDAYLDRLEASSGRGGSGVERKRLRSALAEIRKQGVTSTTAEFSSEAHAVAAPIKGPDGRRAIAALHVAIPHTRFTHAIESKCKRALKRAVAEIERSMAT